MCFADPLSQTNLQLYMCEVGVGKEVDCHIGGAGKTLNLSNPIGHFRVAVCLSFEVSLGAKLL